MPSADGCASTPDGGGPGNGEGEADYTVCFHTACGKPSERYGVWSAEFPESMGRKSGNVTSPEFAEAVRRAKVTERPERMEGDHLDKSLSLDKSLTLGIAWGKLGSALS